MHQGHLTSEDDGGAGFCGNGWDEGENFCDFAEIERHFSAICHPEQDVPHLGFPLHQLSTSTVHVRAHPENTHVLSVHAQLY